WGFWGNVTGNPARKGELFEQPLHPRFILRDERIDFAISSFEVSIRHQSRPPMSRPSDVDRIQIVFPNDTIHMDIDKVQSWCGPPVPQQSWFDVFESQGLLE